MALGTVAWFDDLKGFGFITPTEGGDDIFVHFTGIKPPEGGGRRSLIKDQSVEYVESTYGDRIVASEVVVIG